MKFALFLIAACIAMQENIIIDNLYPKANQVTEKNSASVPLISDDEEVSSMNVELPVVKKPKNTPILQRWCGAAGEGLGVLVTLVSYATVYLVLATSWLAPIMQEIVLFFDSTGSCLTHRHCYRDKQWIFLQSSKCNPYFQTFGAVQWAVWSLMTGLLLTRFKSRPVLHRINKQRAELNGWQVAFFIGEAIVSFFLMITLYLTILPGRLPWPGHHFQQL